MFRIPRARLNQKFIAPRIQILECVWSSCVEYENTAVSTAIESDTERLEALLSGCVPDLKVNITSELHQIHVLRKQNREMMTHLHSYNAIINNDFLCQEISANCGLVLIRKAFVDILVH